MLYDAAFQPEPLPGRIHTVLQNKTDKGLQAFSPQSFVLIFPAILFLIR